MSHDVVRRYNGARPIQAPAQLLADAIHEIEVLREENARLREALKDLIEDHEYMTDTDFEDDNLARAAARAAIREGEKDD